jgi:hypothetical protein
MDQADEDGDMKIIAESFKQISEFMLIHAPQKLENKNAQLDFQSNFKCKIKDDEHNNQDNNLTSTTANFEKESLTFDMNSKMDQSYETRSNEFPVLHTDNLGNKYNFRVFMFCYTVGKEEICLELARYYNTKIVVDRDRYQMIKALNYHTEYFTNNPNEGFIHLTKGLNSEHTLSKTDVIHISLTGWINCKSYLCLRKGQYQVPYSSHSNFEELDRFVSIVDPGIINPVVVERQDALNLNVAGIKSMASYFFWLRNFKKRGMQLLSLIIRRSV